MSRFLASALGVAVLLGALSTLAVAGQPDPANCTWDDLVGVSPKNECVAPANTYTFTGTIRDGAGVPIANFPAANLELDFTNCPNQPLRPANQIAADLDSGPSGEVLWRLNLDFGGSDPCEVQVLVQNVVFATLAGHQGLTTGPETPPCTIDGGVRSVDFNGDNVVGLPDLGALQQEFFNTGVRLDYVGDMAQGAGFDGCTSLPDLGQLQAHFFAPCN